MTLMCMDGGLEGLKTENVEKALVLQWFLDQGYENIQNVHFVAATRKKKSRTP